MKKKNPNSSVIAYPSSPEPLLSPPSYLSLHPWIGYLVFIVFGLLFAFTSYQVVTNGPLTQWDKPAAQAIYNWAKTQPQPEVLFWRFWSSYGRDGVTLIALILTVGWVRRKARRELWMLFFGFFGGELWFQIFSNLFGRERPQFKDPFEKLIGSGYPSGHATTNVLLAWLIIALVLPHIRSTAGRVLLVLANVLVVVLICFSRLFLGLHYLTDIAGGIFLGLAWGGLIYTLTDLYWFRRRTTVTPMPVAVPITGEEKEKH